MFVFLPCGILFQVDGASSSEFASANQLIQSAYVATLNAEKSGGNVTVLVTELQSAVELVQKATLENSTNPSQSANDLQSAGEIADGVIEQSGPISREGAAMREIQTVESVGSAAAIIVAGLMIYHYGDKIYRRLWLFFYRDFLVKKGYKKSENTKEK